MIVSFNFGSFQTIQQDDEKRLNQRRQRPKVRERRCDNSLYDTPELPTTFKPLLERYKLLFRSHRGFAVYKQVAICWTTHFLIERVCTDKTVLGAYRKVISNYFECTATQVVAKMSTKPVLPIRNAIVYRLDRVVGSLEALHAGQDFTTLTSPAVGYRKYLNRPSVGRACTYTEVVSRLAWPNCSFTSPIGQPLSSACDAAA
jgi:hypothetical protein